MSANSSTVEAITGGLGGLLGRFVAYPFETLRQAKNANPDSGLLAILFDIKNLYNGLKYSLLEAFLCKAMQMYVVTGLRGVYQKMLEKDAGRRRASTMSGTGSGKTSSSGASSSLWMSIVIPNPKQHR